MPGGGDVCVGGGRTEDMMGVELREWYVLVEARAARAVVGWMRMELGDFAGPSDCL